MIRPAVPNHQTAMVITEGRVDVDEPVRVLSRGAYVADVEALAERARNSPIRKSLSMRHGASAAATPETSNEGLQIAMRNLRADFDVVGIMEDMDAFLVKVALSSHWDPVSLAYKPARVRENAAVERQHHQTADKCSVRARHLSAEALGEISRIVSDEQVLYALASQLHEEQKKSFAGFQVGLEALRSANEELYDCVE